MQTARVTEGDYKQGLLLPAAALAAPKPYPAAALAAPKPYDHLARAHSATWRCDLALDAPCLCCSAAQPEGPPAWRPWPGPPARPAAPGPGGSTRQAGRAREARLLRVACLALCVLLLVATDSTPANFCVADEMSCDFTDLIRFSVMFKL